MNITSTAGFASEPRSRWNDFWASFPAPFSIILQPKPMMPCLYAGTLLIPSQGWKQHWTECHTCCCVFPCNTAMLRNLPESAALAVSSLGTAIGLPQQALVTLLALLPTDSWKSVCNYCTNQTQEERGVILKAFYMKSVQEARDRARLWLFVCMEWDWEREGVPRRRVTSSRWQQWATAAGYAPFSSRCTQAPEVSVSSASDQQIYKTICLGTNCTQPSQLCCPDLHHTQTIQGLLWIS